jgi:hypothetical protein
MNISKMQILQVSEVCSVVQTSTPKGYDTRKNTIRPWFQSMKEYKSIEVDSTSETLSPQESEV